MSKETDTNLDPVPEGVTPTAEDTTALKKALEAERRKAREFERMLKDRERTEEEVKTAKEREEMERRGEYEKLRAADQAALKKYQDEIEALRGKEKKMAIGHAALEAITSSGGRPKALELHLLQRLEAVPDGEGFKIVVAGDPSKTAKELVAEWKLDPEWAWGFNGVGASGSSAPQAGGTVSKAWNQLTLTEQGQLFKSNPDKAKALMNGAKHG
jgi:tripartite-type tricarboxylate transporter receptor subunit TctC